MSKHETRKKKFYPEMDNEEKITYSIGEIEHILSNTLNEESMGFWQVLKTLLSGPKSWSQIKQNVNMSSRTLTKKMKAMQDLGLVKRKVESSFPPRTEYSLNEVAFTINKLEYLKESVNAIEGTWNLVRNAMSASVSEEKSTKEILDVLTRTLETVVLIWLRSFVGDPITDPITDPEIVCQVWHTTFTTIAIMQLFWGCYVTLVASPDRQKESFALLDKMIQERMESTTPKEREVILKALAPLLN